MQNHHSNTIRKVLTVTELTTDIKALLEETYPFIWITGEISNLRSPASGHFYFTLKDSDAQILAVMFKVQNRALKFIPEDGMSITGFGRITVYPPRGNYQLIVEYMEPAGAGALQAAFEQLKRKLAGEGLFDVSRKRKIPFLPAKVAIISSPTGAVVHDIIRVIHRRFPDMPIEILPVKVQGDGAIQEIVSAIRLLNTRIDADVAILARGGGSLEDMAAFNSEAVARGIFDSRVPIVSAIGHETDFSIADFVADLRAPTPSAAAEMVVPVKADLAYTLVSFTRRLGFRLRQNLLENRGSMEKLCRRLVHPKRRLDDLKLKLDDQGIRLNQAAMRQLQASRERLAWRTERLLVNTPHQLAAALQEKIDRRRNIMRSSILADLNRRRARIESLSGRLRALNPAAVLERGYSITRSLPEQAIVTDAGQVQTGRNIEVILARGGLTCRVERKISDGKEIV